MKRLMKTILLVVIISILLIGCKKNAAEEEEVETIFAVNVSKATKGELHNFLQLTGDVKTKNEVAVYPDSSGRIAELKVNLGSKVEKNQIIAYIDPSKPGMTYSNSPVKSPISGTITALPFKIGETVSMQSAIAKVGRLDQIEVITYIPEKYISKLKQGLEAIITVDAYPDVSFTGKVNEISPVIDPVTRMQEIKISIKDLKQQLKPGMFADIKVITEKKENIIKVQSEAIIKRDSKYYIYVLKKSSNSEEAREVERKEIKVGIEISNISEIVEGLSENDEIVIRGQTLLGDNSKVKVIQTIEPLPEEDVIQ